MCTYVVSHTEVTRSLSEPGAFLREAPVCKKLTPKLVPIRPKKILQLVGAMSWHHAKLHDFQACFGFTGIKKPSFSIFPAEPRCTDVWITFTFLAWYLEIHPRTHMWLFNQVWCTAACAWVQISIMHINALKTQLMHKECTNEPQKFQNLTGHSYSSMLPL